MEYIGIRSLAALLCTLAILVFAGLAPKAAHAADAYKVDPVHSSVVFGIEHLGVAAFYGAFTDIEGEIVFDENNLKQSSVNIAVPVKKVDTRNWMRDRHLKSKDFFNAGKFSEMTFQSARVEKITRDTYEVQGVFSMMGIARDMTIEVTMTGQGKGMQKEERIGFGAEFTIKRSDYGMTYGMEGLLGDDVKVCLSVEGVKK
ncbi:MAG: YceI family protein [Desulfatibacillum sp.]|nr:YceI family protein [Desulfatibacillum sp.]